MIPLKKDPPFYKTNTINYHLLKGNMFDFICDSTDRILIRILCQDEWRRIEKK